MTTMVTIYIFNGRYIHDNVLKNKIIYKRKSLLIYIEKHLDDKFKVVTIGSSENQLWRIKFKK